MAEIPCDVCDPRNAGWGRRDPETGQVVDTNVRCPDCNPRPDHTAVYVDNPTKVANPDEEPTSEDRVPNPLNQQSR